MKARFLVVLLMAVVLLLHPSAMKAETPSLPINSEEIDAIAAEGMRDYRIPGLAFGVVKGDQAVYLKGYGKADDKGRPITPQTPFILGSVTKSITALAVMQLAEQGKLDLDAPVQDVLPWLELNDPEGREVTVRQLLNQTSGISAYEGRVILTEGSDSLERTVRGLSGMDIAEPAGTRFQYANTNYIILGEIVEYVSGLSYAQYIEDNVFKPLTMNNSYADKSEAVKGGLANGYQSLFGKVSRTNPRIWKSNVPSGYLMSSAEDMTHYLIAQMNGGKYGEAAVTSPLGMEAMHRTSEVSNYGMGWIITPLTISHGGDPENYHSEVILFPESGWGIVMLFNTNNVLMTKFYGNMYEELAFRLISAASNGEAFPGGIMSVTQPGNVEVYLNVALGIAAIGLSWSIYRLKHWKRAMRLPVWRIVMNHAVIGIVYIAIPVIVYFKIQQWSATPWKLLLKFVPGVAHATLILCLLAIAIGTIRMAIALYWILYGGVKDRQHRTSSVA